MCKQVAQRDSACREDGCCESSLARRDFIKIAGIGAAGAGVGRLPLMAGPFQPEDVEPSHPIPQDKKLDPAWVQSLFERGEPTIYRGWDELKHIGMPVGGIAAGTVYLGGDGQLWCWDIFNEHHEGCLPNTVRDRRDIVADGGPITERNGANYVQPTDNQSSPWSIEQGFVLTVGEGEERQRRLLNRRGFADIAFTGQYPIGTVNYRDHDCPLAVDLEAFTPFIPLDVDRSSYPAAVMRFRLTNESDAPQTATVTGFIENPVLNAHAELPGIHRVLTQCPHGVAGTIEQRQETTDEPPPRDEILFEDFEGKDWGEWVADGKAMAGGPFPRKDLRPVQNSAGYEGEQFVNTYNTRASEGSNPDDLIGMATSPKFVVRRKFVNLLIGGGKRPDDAFVEVLVDGNSVGKVTGLGDNTLRPQSIDVSAYEGQNAQIRIVDAARGPWAQIVVDKITFSDERTSSHERVEELPDYGSVALVAVSPSEVKTGVWDDATITVDTSGWNQRGKVDVPLSDYLIGGVETQLQLQPGESEEIALIVAWHFPNTHLQGKKRWYASRFESAQGVAETIAADLEELTRTTRLWRDVWYSGSLPHWFLERTLLTVDSLQTNNAYRFEDGQFWAWEGVGCCPGTCTHVWHYAQAVGRLFPALERDLRERTDFGVAFRAADGFIDFRGGQAGRDATDGQAGVILRTFREHQMSPDNAFLKRVWPRCKQALEFLVAQDARDGDPDGVPVGEQHNTLDAEWFGKIPVLTSLYLAALRAGVEMAKAVGDGPAAARFDSIYEHGRENILSLFDQQHGFFIQHEVPGHEDAIGIGSGCYIDQVMGQWWAFQLGLGRLYDGDKIRKALHSLWTYNFCPDMGRLRAAIANSRIAGRPYALAGDAGLVMCTWPKGGKRDDWERHWQFGYFNECMTGFEYEAAGHMIWESKWDASLLEKGLAVTRAIHDRYHASMRNPFNEIECSDHYARAMASYGVFLAACGFQYDGPQGHLAFSPRLCPESFEAAFTGAAGWGKISQRRQPGAQKQKVAVAWGELELRTLAFDLPDNFRPTVVSVQLDEKMVNASLEINDQRAHVALAQPVSMVAGQTLSIVFR